MNTYLVPGKGVGLKKGGCDIAPVEKEGPGIVDDGTGPPVIVNSGEMFPGSPNTI